AAAAAFMSVADSFSRLSQPGMAACKMAGAFNAFQTFSRGAAIRRSPVMSIAGRSPLRAPDVTYRGGVLQPTPPEGSGSVRPRLKISLSDIRLNAAVPVPYSRHG